MEFGKNKAQHKNEIYWNETLQAWIVWQFEQVSSILKDDRFSTASDIEKNASAFPSKTAHLSFRQSISKNIQQELNWACNEMKKLAIEICERHKDLKNFDLQKDIVLPWCHQIALILTGLKEEPNPDKLLAAANAIFLLQEKGKRKAGENATNELSIVLMRKIRLPQNDASSNYLNSFLQNFQVPESSIAILIQLFVGMATSLPLLLGNATMALLRDQKQAIHFLENPKIHSKELIRFAGSAQFVYRTASTNIQIGKHLFKRGDKIALHLAQANRDVSKFNLPNQLDFKRRDFSHLSFGAGMHACLGIPLIKEACEIVPSVILEYFPNLEPQLGHIKIGGSETISGIISLPVLVN